MSELLRVEDAVPIGAMNVDPASDEGWLFDGVGVGDAEPFHEEGVSEWLDPI